MDYKDKVLGLQKERDRIVPSAYGGIETDSVLFVVMLSCSSVVTVPRSLAEINIHLQLEAR